jgi:hypothetical protein
MIEEQWQAWLLAELCSVYFRAWWRWQWNNTTCSGEWTISYLYQNLVLSSLHSPVNCFYLSPFFHRQYSKLCNEIFTHHLVLYKYLNLMNIFHTAYIHQLTDKFYIINILFLFQNLKFFSLLSYIYYRNVIVFFFYGSTALFGCLGLLIFRGFTITHFLDTPQSVGLLWSSDQLVAETSTWQHTTLTTDRHPCPRWDLFFVPVRGFPPLIHFILFKSFRPSCHFTFHATVLTTNTTQTSMPPVGFQPTIPVSERPQTHALDRTATGIGM